MKSREQELMLIMNSNKCQNQLIKIAWLVVEVSSNTEIYRFDLIVKDVMLNHLRINQSIKINKHSTNSISNPLRSVQPCM